VRRAQLFGVVALATECGIGMAHGVSAAVWVGQSTTQLGDEANDETKRCYMLLANLN
jgi:hypothetical protein